jgi:ADP-heptose:LPS heptosyltransferase
MRVIVIRFSALGDCILLCPFLAHLKANGADDVTVVSKRSFVELFSAARGVDRIVALDEKAGMRGIRQIIDSRKNEDAVVIDAHNTIRSRILGRGLGGVEARLKKFYTKRVGLILFKRACAIPTMAQRYSDLGESLGLPPMTESIGGIEVPGWARRSVDEPLANISGRLVSIAAGSKWPTKQWGLDKFVELTRRLIEDRDIHIVLHGNTEERRDAEVIVGLFPGRVTNLAGHVGILESAAVIERSAVFVGNDSGLMHLSEAVGTPVVALFGPTVEQFGYFPSLPSSKVVERALPCRPCSRNGRRPCPRGSQECLVGLATEWVETAVRDSLAGRGPRRYVHN